MVESALDLSFLLRVESDGDPFLHRHKRKNARGGEGDKERLSAESLSSARRTTESTSMQNASPRSSMLGIAVENSGFFCNADDLAWVSPNTYSR